MCVPGSGVTLNVSQKSIETVRRTSAILLYDFDPFVPSSFKLMLEQFCVVACLLVCSLMFGAGKYFFPRFSFVSSESLSEVSFGSNPFECRSRHIGSSNGTALSTMTLPNFIWFNFLTNLVPNSGTIGSGTIELLPRPACVLFCARFSRHSSIRFSFEWPNRSIETGINSLNSQTGSTGKRISQFGVLGGAGTANLGGPKPVIFFKSRKDSNYSAVAVVRIFV